MSTTSEAGDATVNDADGILAAVSPSDEEDLGAVDRALAEDADVEGVAVAALGARSERLDAPVAERLRDEAVEHRRLRRGALRPVHAQVPGLLVELVLHDVERRDLEEGVNHLRRVRSGREAVPGVLAVGVEALVHPSERVEISTSAIEAAMAAMTAGCPA